MTSAAHQTEHAVRRQLLNFDGRATAQLEAAAADLNLSPSYADALLRLAGEGEVKLEVGATWLLKRLRDSGHAWTPEQHRGLLDLVFSVTAPDALLHLLQVLEPALIESRRRVRFVEHLFDLTQHDNGFVRAWSFGLLVKMVRLTPSRAATIERMLERAETSESASVKARIRRARKELTT